MLTSAMRFWFPVGIITLLVIAFMSNDLFIPSMPELATSLGVSANVIQNAIAIWFYGSMTLQVVLGPISDQYGRKPILLVSSIVLIAASFLCAFSHDIVTFFVGRFLQGVGVSGIMVTAFAALHEVYEQENNGTKILGYVGLCTALSPLLGPLVGGYISAYFGWEANFIAVTVIGIALTTILFRAMPETITHSPQRIQWTKIVASYKKLLTHRVYMTTVLCYGLLFFTGGAFLAVAPFIVVDLLGFPAQYVGYAMMPMFLCYMFTSGLAGKLEKVISANKLIGVSLTILSLMMLIFMAESVALDNNAVFILAGISCYYLGLGLIGPPLNNISLSQVTSEHKGSASAVLTVIMMLGSALGASVVSYFYNGHLLSIALVMGIAILLALAVFFVYLTSQLSIKTEERNPV